MIYFLDVMSNLGCMQIEQRELISDELSTCKTLNRIFRRATPEMRFRMVQSLALMLSWLNPASDTRVFIVASTSCMLS
jgi:hypothetical protein